MQSRPVTTGSVVAGANVVVDVELVEAASAVEGVAVLDTVGDVEAVAAGATEEGVTVWAATASSGFTTWSELALADASTTCAEEEQPAATSIAAAAMAMIRTWRGRLKTGTLRP